MNMVTEAYKAESTTSPKGSWHSEHSPFPTVWGFYNASSFPTEEAFLIQPKHWKQDLLLSSDPSMNIGYV